MVVYVYMMAFVAVVPVVNKFQHVIPNDLRGVPLPQEIDFRINLKPDIKPISILPYGMDPTELKELKL